ncbi:MAG TPA: GAF domain-containing protein [Vicinamibacterales bacterium]|nr:GAF domain-containing protein [Vicinamibacterales bacterium]HPK71664.1 GAF domain-containing protein [Vicinamibacterales bacterium]
MTQSIDFDVMTPGDGERGGVSKSDRQLLTTLFALGREVTSVLDLAELYRKLPGLIARVTDFHAFAVYVLDERQGRLRIAHAEGYPPGSRSLRLRPGQGLVGRAAADGRPLLANDVSKEPDYLRIVPGTRAELAVPLRRKGRSIGVLNLLSRNLHEFTPAEVETLRIFGAAVATAIENARLFESERRYAETISTLAEIGREFAGILELDHLLERIAHRVRRLIEYRTFGILLVDEDTGEIRMRHAVRYNEGTAAKALKIGEGLVGYAVLHKTPVVVDDVAADPRYIKVMDDVQSELVVPLLVKDRCVGVFDLESPERASFTQEHVEVLTSLAASAAVAIDNARLYEELRRSEERLAGEVAFAQRIQRALLPAAPPRRVKGVDVAARFEPARELGGDFYDFLALEPHTLSVAVADVSGKGVPAALYGAFAGELVRSRTFRRRYTKVRTGPASILESMNTILHERRLENYYCTLCYAHFDFRRRSVTLSNSGLPYPLHASPEGCGRLQAPGVPLGSLPGTTYDELTVELNAGDVFVFHTDGITETMNASGEDFGSERLVAAVCRNRERPAQAIADAIFEAVDDFRGGAEQHDDRTVVVLKITGQEQESRSRERTGGRRSNRVR